MPLELYEFPIENFITIYKSPYSNGILSKPFSPGRGSRQGCPPPPSLFTVATEPLAKKIKQKVSGIITAISGTINVVYLRTVLCFT